MHGYHTLKSHIFALAGVLLAAMSARAGDSLRRKAILIMVDGLRADAMESGAMPNLQKLRKGEWRPGYRSAWSVTAQTAPGSIPSSAPNHVSIATGCAVGVHGVSENDVLSGGVYSGKPTWLQRVAAANGGTAPLFVYAWEPDGNICPSEEVEFMSGTDAANATALAARLAAENAPDAIMYFIDCVDAAGHKGDFYPMTAGYLAAASQADGYIGGCLEAIAGRMSFEEEDWLILVVSDHGGYSNQHGRINAYNQASHSVPLVIAGRNVAPGRIPGCPRNYDAAACALAHLGVSPEDPDFTAEMRGGAPETERLLTDGLAAYLPFNSSVAENKVSGSAVAPVANGSAALAPNGFFGKGLELASAGGGHIKLNGSESLAFEDSGRSFTATVWVKYNVGGLSGNPVVFGNKAWTGMGDAGAGVVLTARTAPVLSGTTYTGAGFNAGGGATALDIMPFKAEGSALWTFYAVTRRDDGVFTVYQGRSDGTLGWTSGTLDGFSLASGLPFCIGQDGAAAFADVFAGGMDDFALWTRGLSHADIRRIYECGRAGMELGDILKMEANDAPSMEVSAPTDSSVTLAFGGRRTKNLSLCVAYGEADGESDKYAWTSFETLAAIAPETTSYTYSIPGSLRDAGLRFRFFLMQTGDLPYAKETEYTHSASGATAWLDTGIAPRRHVVSEFDVRLTAENGKYQNILGGFSVDGDKKSNYGLCRIQASDASHPSSLDREYNTMTGNKYQFTPNNTCLLDTDYHILFSSTNLTVNGAFYGSDITAAQFVEGGVTINMFRCAKLVKNAAEPTQYDQAMAGRFKSFKMYTPERTVRDLKPAVASNGTAGFFDAVTGAFYESAGGEPFAAGGDLDSSRYGWIRAETQTFKAGADLAAATAIYTGAGANPLDFADGANWICCNINGTQLPSTAVPDADTAITVAGATPFAIPQGASMPACASIKFDSATPATGASDWTGLDYTKVTSDSVIDLKGGMLSLPAPNGTAANAFTVKDTSVDASSPGTLEFNVASGTFANSAIALSGNLKLVKTGAGTFQPGKTGQTYTGGTVVGAGIIKLASATSGLFGTGSVTVDPDGVFDANGKDASSVALILAGGKLCSTATSKGTYPKKLVLTENSTLEQVVNNSYNDMEIPAGCDWNLGGKTLSVNMGGNDTDLNMSYAAVNYITNGTFAITVGNVGNVNKGYFAIRRLEGKDGLKLDLGNSFMRLQSTGGTSRNSSVLDFTANPPAASTVYSYLQNRLEVHGVYTPPSSAHLGFMLTMMDGSTLNLAGRTGAWSCKFTNSGGYASGSTNPCYVQFAGGATVTVDLTGRDLKTIAAGADGAYVLKWHAGAVPAAGVTFVPDAAAAARGYYFEKDDTGLRLMQRPGFKVRIAQTNVKCRM